VPGQEMVGLYRNYYRVLMTLYLTIGILLNMLFLNVAIKMPLIKRINSLINRPTKIIYEIENAAQDHKRDRISDILYENNLTDENDEVNSIDFIGNDNEVNLVDLTDKE
jgi:hypothetical protein